MTRSFRSALNLLTQSASSVVLLLTGMVTTPWLLSLLGVEPYGAFRALTDLTGYVGLLDLGLGGAIRSKLGVAVGRGDDNEIRKVVAAGASIYVRVSAAMLMFGIALTWVAPRFIKLDLIPASELRWATAIMMAPCLLAITGTIRILAEAMQRGYVPTTLISCQLLLTTVLSLTFAGLGFGIVGQALAFSLAQLPVALYLLYFAQKQFPGVLTAKAEKQDTDQIWGLNGPNLLFSASSRFGLVSDNLVIAWGLGSAHVAPFYLTQRLMAIAQTQVQSVGNSTWAALVQLHARGERELFVERLLQLTSAVSALGLVAAGPLAAYNHHFIERWVGSGMYAGSGVNILATANMWLLGIYSLWAWPLSAGGFMSKLAPVSALSMAVNLSISIGATIAFGASGPLLGTLAGFVLVNSWAYSRLLKGAFGVEPAQLWRAALVHLVWAIPYCAALWQLAHSHTPPTWSHLLAEMGASGLVGLGLWWCFGLGALERSFWKNRVLVLSGRAAYGHS